MNEKQLPEQFYAARHDENLVILEGFHAVKHAVRFGAKIVSAVTFARADVLSLVARHAPESRDMFGTLLQNISQDTYFRLAPRPPRTGVIAIAHRPHYALVDMEKSNAPIVLVDDARDLDNLGACVRVAAGYGAAGVIAAGATDPWKPACLRGSTGLHFALPVVHYQQKRHLGEVCALNRPLYVFDENGEDMKDVTILSKSIVVFGSERAGVSNALKVRAQKVLRIPMQENVSSLNLATSVAAGLYGGTYA